jgi:hypothetical protein
LQQRIIIEMEEEVSRSVQSFKVMKPEILKEILN